MLQALSTTSTPSSSSSSSVDSVWEAIETYLQAQTELIELKTKLLQVSSVHGRCGGDTSLLASMIRSKYNYYNRLFVQITAPYLELREKVNGILMTLQRRVQARAPKTLGLEFVRQRFKARAPLNNAPETPNRMNNEMEDGNDVDLVLKVDLWRRLSFSIAHVCTI